MEPISIMGEWWLPNSPDHKVSGKLEFDPEEGIELKLMGELKEEDAERKERFRNKEPLQPEIILGETAEAENITIIDCYESNRRNHRTPESHKIRLWISGQYLIKGEHFSRKENIEFQRITFTLPYLEKYLDFRSTYTQMMPQEEEYDRKAEFELPETLEASLEDLELSIWFRTEGAVSDRQNISFRQEAIVQFEPESGLIGFHDSWKLGKYFGDFLSLMTAKNLDFSSAKARTDSSARAIGVEKEEMPEIPNQVEIFSKLKLDYEEDDRFQSQIDSLVPFQHIELSFEELIQNWFKLREEHEMFFDLYFATRYNSSMYANNQFLNLMQGLESYHRGKFRGKYDGELISDLKENLEDIKPDKEESKKLRYKVNGYKSRIAEYSIRDRIEEVKSNADPVLPERVAKDEDFVKRSVNYRHKLTHPDGDTNSNMDYSELIWDTTRLRLLSEASILQDLGLEEDLIVECFNKNNRYQRLVRGEK